MVELYIKPYEVSNLEWMLVAANIEYQLCIDIGNYGITSPYLVVDGVPLDEKRAKIWIKEHRNDG